MPWLVHLLYGLALLTCCIFVHVFGLIIISRIINHENVDRLRNQSILFATVTFALSALSAATLFFIQALVWGLFYIQLHAINDIERAISFSIGTFTTYGNSGFVLDNSWILLSEIQAINGVMAFGITTAFLFNLSKRLQPKS